MKKKVLISIVLLVGFILSPLGSYGLSLSVMKVYSNYEERESFMAERGIEIDMPSSDGWYPFVMVFDAGSGFAQFTGHPGLKLTIMYNFPKFDLSKGCSKLYEPSSPYYSSFYGAYCVSGDYGFSEDKSLDASLVGKAFEYDFTKLVLDDLGMKPEAKVFEWSWEEKPAEEALAGYKGWNVAEADLLVNGLLHEKKKYFRNYIQYGTPKYYAKFDFQPVKMRGKIYGRYFKEWDCGIYFYILARDEEVLRRCDEEIIRKSKIKACE